MARIACLLLRLYVRREKTRLIPIVWLFLHSALPLGLFPNFSPNFYCFHMDGICYNEAQIAVGHSKRYFKYTLYIIISVNIVMYSSKDWSFNQILAHLWSFFEHISICLDYFL